MVRAWAFATVGFSLLSLVLATSSCTLPSDPGASQAEQVVEALRYRRDKHGNCLAFVVSATYYSYQVVSFAQVDKGCTP